MRRWIGFLALLGLLLGADGAAAADRMSLWTNHDGPHLRGANLFQRRVYPDLDGPEFLGAGPFGPPVDQADLDILAAAGANAVVLSHPGIFSETPPYRLDPAAKANLDRLVGMAQEADLFVVIAFRTGPGRSEFAIQADSMGSWFDASYLNTTVWGDAAAQDGWVAMWQATAEAYRGNPVVVGYELMVEPNSNHIGSDAVRGALEVWDPSAFEASHAGSLYDWNQLHPRILSAIRAVDPDMPVLIGGNGYSAVGWLPYVTVGTDPRTVFTFHEYEPSGYTHQEPGAGAVYPGRIDLDWDGQIDRFDIRGLEALLEPVDAFVPAHTAPVAVTEFGVVRWAPGVGHFLADRVATFENRGLNWMIWGWPVAWRPVAETDNGFSLAFGSEPASTSPSSAAPGFDALLEAWSRNVARPSNTSF